MFDSRAQSGASRLSRAAVDEFHVTGRKLGAGNNGDPGVRRGRYYCAYLIDFDGNNIEAGVYA